MGSDIIFLIRCLSLWKFQSTLPRGERRFPTLQIRSNGFCFNPRSRVGSDLVQTPATPPVICFNPRSRVGSDCNHYQCLGQPVCFNPRSRVGSDFQPAPRMNTKKSFNPRSRVGSDVAGLETILLRIVSIHAPAWGATCALPIGSGADRFQSTLPRGERPPQSVEIGGHSYVSIHAPAWGATIPF